jgi:hypothetical protein
MPHYTISVTRRVGTPYVRASAGLVWFDVGGRHESVLAELTLELEKGPAKEILARALEQLASELLSSDG